MLRRTIVFAWVGLFGALLPLSPTWAKDQSQIPVGEAGAPVAQPAPSEPGAAPPGVPEAGSPDQQEPESQPPGADEPDEVAPDELSLGEVPVIETVELTPETARRAVDAFALVREKYRDANLEDYENLQDFVDQTADGKAFETDIKTFGFNTVTEWNTAITTVSFAYSALTDPQTIADAKAQIETTRKDAELAQDMKDRMIASLTAMIPSDNNKKVVQALIADPAYTDKLKLLSEEEE